MVGIEEVLIFDLKGPFAHFRKYYTNSSSLTYLFPPRTVLTGLIAGLLGEPKDSYYEDFSDERCKIAVSIRKPVRTIMQTINYTKTKTDQSSTYSFKALISGRAGMPTQIPLEIIRPVDDKEIVYRIYFWHSNGKYNKLKQRLQEYRFKYPPYLGITEFIGELSFVNEGDIKLGNREKVVLSTICRKDAIEELDFDGEHQYIIEMAPADFSKERKLTRRNEYVVDKRSMDIPITKLKESFFEVRYSENGAIIQENIIFL